MKKIEELFAALSEPTVLRDGLSSIKIEDINKYWMSGKLQQPKGEDEGLSEIRRILLIAFSPDESLPAQYRTAPRLRTAPGYIRDFAYYRNEAKFEPAGTLTITTEFNTLPLSFFSEIYSVLGIQKVRIQAGAFESLFSTGKIAFLQGIRHIEILGQLDYSVKLKNLPADIGSLSDLEEFTAIHCAISELPESLFELRKLRKLDLSGNALTALSVGIAQLTSLEELNVSMNKLERVPDSIAQMVKLSEIKVFDNPFKEISDVIAFRTYRYNYTFDNETKTDIELKYPKDVLLINSSWLQVPMGRIEEILLKYNIRTLRVESAEMLNKILLPENVGYFKSIKHLDLQWNVWKMNGYEPGFFRNMVTVFNLPTNLAAKVKELPEGIASMTWLEELNLSGNILEKVPDGLFSLTKLKRLNLYGNKLKELPDRFDALSELEFLNLGNAELSAIPESVFTLKKLTNLNLGWNRTIEVVSHSIGNLTQLEVLSLESNAIKALPQEFSQLKALKFLELSGNQLSEFPTAVLELSKLKELMLENNPILSLPQTLVNLSELEVLGLKQTSLKTVGSAIGDLKSLKKLSLENCKIEEVDKAIGQCSQLKELILYVVEEIKELPNSLGDLTELENLTIYGCNKNVAVLPSSLGNLKKLSKLTVFGSGVNTKTQEFPKFILELSSLKELLLSSTPISALPSEINKLKELEVLNLGYTELDSLPEEIGELSKLTKLSGPSLKSPLPLGIGSLTNLQELDINFDNVAAPFPETIGNLKALKKLSCWCKGISQLPSTFGQLDGLRHISLRKGIFPTIPLELMQLKNLDHLDLMENGIEDVPNELNALNKLNIIYLDDNPIVNSTKLKRVQALLPGVYISK
jgi:Leucine-rich repeat (LRR) protein